MKIEPLTTLIDSSKGPDFRISEGIKKREKMKGDFEESLDETRKDDESEESSQGLVKSLPNKVIDNR